MAKCKYHVGDVVRVTVTSIAYKKGYIGTITHVGSMGTWGYENAVYLDGEKRHRWIWDDYVEKIGGVGMFSVGDKVMIKDGVMSGDNSHHWGGDIGYIAEHRHDNNKHEWQLEGGRHCMTSELILMEAARGTLTYDFKAGDTMYCVVNERYEKTFTLGKMYTCKRVIHNIHCQNTIDVLGNDGRINEAFVYRFRKGETMNRYQALKKRIEGLENGLDNEADAILAEINAPYELVISTNAPHSGAAIGIVSCPLRTHSSADYHTTIDYSTTSSKMRAIRDACLWILDHSNIKDSLVGEKATVCIGGKTYKVDVVEEV